MIRTITPIFSIIVAFVVFFFYSKPTYTEVKTLQAEQERFDEAIGKAQELNSELNRKITQKRSYTSDQIERLDTLVPQAINEVTVLTDLNEMARTHRMLFGNVSVDATRQELSEGAPISNKIQYDDIQKSSITFSLIGTYNQFKSFLADMERSLVLLEITNISFVVGGEGDLQQFEITAHVFSMPPTN